MFYVGKGSRAFAHLRSKATKEVAKIIRSVRAACGEPRVEIPVHGLAKETTAFQVEGNAVTYVNIKRL